MIKITASIVIQGKKFNPIEFEKNVGINLVKKICVGDIQSIGRYKNKPSPYGSASIEVPTTVASNERVLYLAKLFAGKLDLVKKYGGDDAWFWIGYWHDGQCNCELSEDELSWLAKTEIPYLFSVYQVDNLDDID